MDGKKVVQTAGPAAVVQPCKKLEGPGSVSGLRRRSGPQSLRSPAAKRPLSAPVALQGWLHKQGSEGLMLWKKRWFVLSEYCLFYYKGPEEEKLLGSILLPSYKVTVCKPEDKVAKKFAFKAEHANMRTYHFAAETRESMNQWVNVLTLATLLQDPNPAVNDAAIALEMAEAGDGDRSARPSVSSISSIMNQSADDSDSGFHGFQSRDDPSHTSNNNSSPNSANTASFPNSANNSTNCMNDPPPQPTINGWMMQQQQSPQYPQPGTSQQPQYNQLVQHQMLFQKHQNSMQHVGNTIYMSQRNLGQPLYANTQTKPRRLMENGPGSPDPDFRKSPVSPADPRTLSKSPMSVEYDLNSGVYGSRITPQQQQPQPNNLRTDKSGLNYGYGQVQVERRTPDAYGRSPKARFPMNGDYEDVYGAQQQSYQRAAGGAEGVQGGKVPVHGERSEQGYGVPPNVDDGAAFTRQQPRAQPPPRPHSADFLEYEATRRPQQHLLNQSEGQANQSQQRPQRPKSSLDIINPTDVVIATDGYFYSEEHYAAQMRQSAVYLHQTPQQHQQQRNQSLSRATTPSSKSTLSRERVAEPGVESFPEIPCPAARHPQRDYAAHQQQHVPPPSKPLQMHNEMSNQARLRRSLREPSYEPNREVLAQNESSTLPGLMPRECHDPANGVIMRQTGALYGNNSQQQQQQQACYPGPKRWKEQQHFARSASARLPRTRHPVTGLHDDDEYNERAPGQDSRDGERKREESMKRLLEWKQRMLQSPLTRKPSGAANRGTAQNELSNYYKQQALIDLAAHEATVAEARHSRRARDDPHRSHPRSKSSDSRRSSGASVPRYNSYSSDDEELGDVRRRRTRRPSHVGRSPRHGDERPIASSHESVVTNQNSAAFGVIPPDAGYEQVDYFTTNFSKDAARPSIKSEKPVPAKKPTGILKTTSGRNEAGKLSTLAGYVPGETWHAPKNVQWDSKNEKQDWADCSKSDETLIKEFSYQYIKPEKSEQLAVEPKTDTMNFVRSRITTFESAAVSLSPVKEILTMQEPLSVSTPHTIEAHVSKLDSSRKGTVIREFALGESLEKVEPEQQVTVSAQNKSVKDLLADFERKSQQVHQEQCQEEEIKHRRVFSDTETLLYDTGSDLDQLEKSDVEEEGEQVVPRSPDFKDDAVGTLKPNSSDKKKTRAPSKLTDDVNLRLSVTESLVTHIDQLSGSSASASPSPKPGNPGLVENHYLPMSPRQAILDPDSQQDSKMMETLFTNLQHEESSYVEMTQSGVTRSLLAPNNDSTKSEYGNYSSLDTSHYEFVCVADNEMEPVYMEVSNFSELVEQSARSTLKKKPGNEKEDVRSDLPDILTALKSDSSDADDESSKDFEAIDAPRHPRFSLSDTFRPASYYLGASHGLIAEMQDSSDSEIVSPPPIPTSPPPMEELHSLDLEDSLEMKKATPQAHAKTSGQTAEAQRPLSRFSENTINSPFRDSRVSLESGSSSDFVELRHSDQEIRHRKLKTRPVSDQVCQVLNSLDELESLDSRFDGASIDLDQYLEELQARDAFNVDLYAKDLSYNSIYGFNENMLLTDKLQKSSCQANIIDGKVNLDQPFQFGSRSKTSSASSLPSMRVSDDVAPKHQHSQSFTGDVHYENVTSFSPLRGSPAVGRCDGEQSRDELFRSPRGTLTASHSRDSSYSMAINSGAKSPGNTRSPSVNSSLDSPEIPPGPANSYNHARSASQDSPGYSPSSHHRCSSSHDSSQYPATLASIKPKSHVFSQQQLQLDLQGAPYYYSDLQSGVNVQMTRTPLSHTSRLPQLNNQRDDSLGLNKRNDIGRMVNPISRQMPRQIQVDDIDEAKRIAAQLRKTTSQLLAENKVGLVDKRNFYEADTLRRVKSTDPLSDTFPDVSTRNLYPQGLRDKSASHTNLLEQVTESPANHPQTSSHRRSRSLEGLLDDVGLENLMEQRARASNRAASTQPTRPEPLENPVTENQETTEAGPPTNASLGSDDPWEQDSLWRESLRRVSLRHARSLDNLDAPSRPETKSRPKITRGATYVNDNVASRREERCAEKPEDEEEAYEVLAMDRVSAGGYVWDPENQVYRKSEKHFLVKGNLPPGPSRATTSFELDREKLRQWDLLSSACLLQEQQRTSMAESGRGLPMSETADVKSDQRSTSASAAEAGQKSRSETPCSKPSPASCSGSVVGRDPLPSRAMSTSQLSQRAPAPEPETMQVVSTLPLPPRPSGINHRHQLAIHHSKPQSPRQSEHPSFINSQVLKATASSGDVRLGSIVNNRNPRMTSPSALPGQRIVSPARLSSDPRMSSPSDNERLFSSPSERIAISPVGRAVERGGSGMGVRQTQCATSRENNELSHKRSNVNRGCRSATLVQVSAGALLGRTHEELVLLLIQLRRQSAILCKAMETCHMEIEAQARLVELDTPRRLENLQKLDELKKHLMDLEKQYEKGKPLVNLVDNMVKLGSLYNRNVANGGSSVSGSRHDLVQENTKEYRDRLEFNQRLQEQRLLAEERRDWDRLSPDQSQLQAKVQQLYRLDQLLQEESGTLHSLQQDKEILEKALMSLRNKLQGNRSSPAETERYKKQQQLLERELSRVRLLLAHKSKKLEETVAENARLEQDLVVLRQKLQASRRYPGLTRDSSGTTATLEAELERVQQLVGDLQRQRQELSVQVRQLTENSHSLIYQMKPHTNGEKRISQAPKKRAQSSWLETDLDSGITFEHGVVSPQNSVSPSIHRITNESPQQQIQQQKQQQLQNQQKQIQLQQQQQQHYHSSPTIYRDNHCYSPPMAPMPPINVPASRQHYPPQNYINSLSPQIREQIQQHQMKQQLLKEQMQGKSNPNVPPLYVNTDCRRLEGQRNYEVTMNGSVSPPEYVAPPPPPPPCEEPHLMMNGHCEQDDNKFTVPCREKQEIKTVRIVKRESERRQRDRGDRTGNIGIPLTNGIPIPGCAKRLNEEELYSSPQAYEGTNHLGRVTEEPAISHAQSTVQLTELEEAQFQRSMSLPRGFGGHRNSPAQQSLPIPTPPRNDSMAAIRNMMARRNKMRYENHDGSDSTLSPPMTTTTSESSVKTEMGPTAQERLFGSVASISSLAELSPQLSPVFNSEAAKEIIKEVTTTTTTTSTKSDDGPRKRLVPKEKRRHYTVSSIKPVFDLEDTFSKMGMGRARDDLDMERALRPRLNAPDVVRSTLSHKELKYNESTIDQLLGTPNKIFIPERYVPEKTPELSVEEQQHRLKKAESIRKMLSETSVSAPGAEDEKDQSNVLKKKVAAEKRQREHILQLNQILAKQVMEKSKMVAVKALTSLDLNQNSNYDDQDLSPVTPLPLYQQRENFYS